MAAKIPIAKHAKQSFDEYRIDPVAGRIAVLASGGLDSSVMLADLARSGCEVFPIYIRAGLIWEREELPALRRFIRALKLANIKPVTPLAVPMNDLAADHWSVTGRGVPGYTASVASNYIPGRNLSLLAKSAIFCARGRIGEVAMAPLESNPFPDARPEFFRAFARAVELGVGLKLKVVTPYVGMTKAEVIQRGADFPLELTLSCARPKAGVHCGECTKCAERIEGFGESGVADRTRYASHPKRPQQ